MSELEALKARVTAIEARLAVVEENKPAAASSPGVADDADLDSEWGDEVIKKDPKRWIEKGGESFAGCRMSECPPDYLMAVASLFDWMADQDEKKGKTYVNKKTGKEQPTAPFSRKSAARARGWAKRNKDKAPAPAPTQATAEDLEVPF